MNLLRKLGLLASCLVGLVAVSSALPLQGPAAERDASAKLQQDFFSDFNLTASAADADQLLRRHPGDVIALFVQMETAALQLRTESVLDSALRLCTMPAPPEIQEIASSRILENAGNSRLFREVLRRVGLAMEEDNACTFNLRLALVAAAADGATSLDLDKTADSAGLLTRWRIAGPFGHFSNLDFNRKWAPESAAYWTSTASSVERFWFRDGMLSFPEYFSAPGIFYAIAEVQSVTNGLSQLDVLSPGPYIVFIDGRPILSMDSRYVTGANRNSATIHLAPGPHRVMVKLTTDATPFSADLHPAFSSSRQRPILSSSPPAADYIRALLEYFRGNLSEVERRTASRSDDDHGPFLYLRALLWSAADDHSPRAAEAWRSLAKAHASALLANAKAAEFSLENDASNELRAEIMKLAQQRPESDIAANLALRVVGSDTPARTRAFAHLLELHPACSYLLDAARFYDFAGDPANAQKTELRMATCAPESLQYARVLSDSGRHRDSAALLEQKIRKNPLNRAARKLLVQELVLSDQLDKAKKQAQELHSIAPGSRIYAKLPSDPAAVLDSNSLRAQNFVSQAEFYARYREDGTQVVRASARDKSLAGSPVAILLSDRVLKIRSDGTASLYSHQVTRLLDHQSISRYGEVVLPRGSEILELRTIKPDGRTVEPELTAQKSAISMPALEPGDCIDEEFVTHYSDWALLPAASSLFEFGSLSAPVLRTQFMLLAPKSANVRIEQLNGAPAGATEAVGEDVVHTWKMDHLAAVAAEPFFPAGVLPAITVRSTESTLERFEDALIDSTRIGPHVVEVALDQRFPANASDREKALVLYQYVTEKLGSTGADFSSSTAEDAFSAGEGSRTSALLALARASGLNATLLLARKIGANCTSNVSLDCYTEPLVRFWVGGEVIDANAEADDVAFGEISPVLDAHNAWLVPLAAGNSDKPEIISLSMPPLQEQTVGEGDLFLDRNGNLSASIHIRLGASRAQEVRAGLHTGSGRERQDLFEQFASRIFPGATAVQGDVSHPAEPQQPLELSLRCAVPQFINMQPGLRETGQLAPLLGLRNSFGKIARRTYPMLLNSVLSESTIFHLHLPEGVSAASLPHDMTINSEFGQYAMKFSEGNGQLNITREFNIPVQLVPAERFPAFLNFARRIDDAERQMITFSIGKEAAIKSSTSAAE
ncbi:MAG TPA: DUF3857 domain-containing protein [Candidatus Angelobacter sp.]|nr:DUF3857 domain-containing protein [Candidatus Angelobacter sp.]